MYRPSCLEPGDHGPASPATGCFLELRLNARLTARGRFLSTTRQSPRFADQPEARLDMGLPGHAFVQPSHQAHVGFPRIRVSGNRVPGCPRLRCRGLLGWRTACRRLHGRGHTCRGLLGQSLPCPGLLRRHIPGRRAFGGVRGGTRGRTLQQLLEFAAELARDDLRVGYQTGVSDSSGCSLPCQAACPGVAPRAGCDRSARRPGRAPRPVRRHWS
jgi:hypothetical protein